MSTLSRTTSRPGNPSGEETRGGGNEGQQEAPQQPDPQRLAKLTLTLQTILEQQLSVTQGQSACAFIGVTTQRMGPLAAQMRGAGQRGQSHDPLSSDIIERLERVAFAACSTQRGVVDYIKLPSQGGMYGQEAKARAAAVPLLADGRCEGATVVLCKSEDATANDDARLLISLTACAGAFETYLWREHCLEVTQQKLMLRQAVELLDISQQAGDVRAMSAALTHELKRRFGCTRVSLGLVGSRGGFIKLVATSGADEVDPVAPAVEALESAMEECAAQNSEVLYPAPGTNELTLRRVTRSHAQLSASFGPCAIVSLPLRVDGGLIGVMLLEREVSDPFPLQALALLRLVAETIGPAVWTRRMADRGMIAVARDRIKELAVAAVGPTHTGKKLVLGLVLAATIASAIVPIPARVAAPAEVHAAASRTISPPFGGYLESVFIRPGDLVEQGQALATMDTADLLLQLAQGQSELTGAKTLRDDALSKGELAKAAQHDAEAHKQQATCELLQQAIDRAIIRSPVTGVVGRGDLEQFVRARVDTTQPLFEIVTSKNVTNAYIDERDIHRVRVGQSGLFISRAFPGEDLRVAVTQITPVAQPHEGRNTYKVELAINDEDAGVSSVIASMRPGMTGKVKLDDGWTTPMVRFARPLIDELRLRLWW